MAITIKKIESWSEKKKTDKLLKALSSDSEEIKVAAIRALGGIKEEKVMHALIALLSDPKAPIRSNAAEALGNIANPRSLEFVRQLWMNETDQEVREKSKEAINKIKANAVKSENN